MVEVHLANGRGVALVDDEDASRVLAEKWHRLQARGCVYAKSSKVGLLHRFVADLSHGDRMEVDHRNGDGLDNRRGNLRVVTHAENQQNRHRQARRTSRYRGVTWCADRRKWMARAKLHGIDHFGGYFTDEGEAGAAAGALRARLMPFATG